MMLHGHFFLAVICTVSRCSTQHSHNACACWDVATIKTAAIMQLAALSVLSPQGRGGNTSAAQAHAGALPCLAPLTLLHPDDGLGWASSHVVSHALAQLTALKLLSHDTVALSFVVWQQFTWRCLCLGACRQRRQL